MARLPPSAEDILFQRGLLDKLVRAAANYARPKIPSQNLRQTMFTRVEIDGKRGFVEIPDYWAVYLHDGRGAFGPRSANVLVYFRDKKQDPRLAPTGQHPKRYAQMKRMTGAQFAYWLRQNNKARALGVPPPMIVKNSVGPQRGTFFFNNNRGMVGFKDRADQIAAPIALKYIRHQLRDFMTVRVGDVAVIPLG